MIRIPKRLWGYLPEIHIAGIRCTQGNIAKVAELFESRFLSVTIEPISADSRFMTCLRELKLYHFRHELTPDAVSVVAPRELFGGVLDLALREAPEVMSIYDMLDPTDPTCWDERVLIRNAELFAAGLTDMLLCVAFDERTIDIAMDRALHPRDIYRKLRALQFE